MTRIFTGLPDAPSLRALCHPRSTGRGLSCATEESSLLHRLVSTSLPSPRGRIADEGTNVTRRSLSVRSWNGSGYGRSPTPAGNLLARCPARSVDLLLTVPNAVPAWQVIACHRARASGDVRPSRDREAPPSRLGCWTGPAIVSGARSDQADQPPGRPTQLQPQGCGQPIA